MFETFKPKKTVASVMASFSQTIADLEAVEAAQNDEAERQSEIAAAATRASIEASQEALKAGNVKAKLDEIINPKIGNKFDRP